MGRRWSFQQDNDPKPTSKSIQKWFSEKTINVWQWPSQSPDLNPIKNMWSEFFCSFSSRVPIILDLTELLSVLLTKCSLFFFIFIEGANNSGTHTIQHCLHKVIYISLMLSYRNAYTNSNELLLICGSKARFAGRKPDNPRTRPTFFSMRALRYESVKESMKCASFHSRCLRQWEPSHPRDVLEEPKAAERLS